MTTLPCWPVSRLGDALQVLARRLGSSRPTAATPNPPDVLPDLDGWIEAAAAALGLEAEPAEFEYARLERDLPSASPALLRAPEGFVLLAGDGIVLGPDLGIHRVSPADLCAALCRDREAPVLAEVDRLLEGAALTPRRRARARAALLRDRLAAERIGGCWLVRTPPGEGFVSQARLPQRLGALAGAHLVEYLLWILAWWTIGKGALEGRLDPGLLASWALIIFTLIPFRALATWLQGRLAILGGGLLRERLLHGSLRLTPDEIRHQGAGQLLGRVMESEAVESLALGGGLLALVALLELALAAVVLGAGARSGWHVALLVVWVAVVLLLGWRYLRAGRRWTADRLDMTHDLVERLAGYRTRLAQEPPERWHEGEDQELERYLDSSARMDRTGAVLIALGPRVWLILALLALTPSFVTGTASAATLAVLLGGILLAERALQRLTMALWNLVGAALAWRQVAPIFHAAARPEAHGAPLAAGASRQDQTLLEASDLVFRHQGRSEPVLRGCSLRVTAGDRLILEGPSGGGKSTLAALLAGLREPESGLLLAGGFDRRTLGAGGWRRVIAAAPQFHENHVITGPLAFNLLMGRPGLLGDPDLAEAETVCRELGLGDLLDRMPAGIMQLVGESGWQLSHGERSRLYIARALLQQADIVLLDESFAALDPENLRRATECVLSRARSVILIAHQ